MAGRGFGKTRTGAEWVREQVRHCRYVNLIAPTTADARDVMVNGESGILAICPRNERPDYYPSKRQLLWPNGAKSLIFSGEDPESLRGPQSERLWADELTAWQYPQETWDMATLGLRLGEDPRACITSTPKPIGVVRQLVHDSDCVITRGRTYDNLDNLAPAFADQIIKRFEGTRLGRQELEGELLEDEGMAYRFDERIHCLPGFEIPAFWRRSEGMDFGSSAPTAWLVFASDDEGNQLAFDELYEPGMPSETAPKILARRAKTWRPQPWEAFDTDGWKTASNAVWGDPVSMQNKPPIPNRFGQRTSLGQEFADCGVPVTPANNARDAGYIRVAELLRCDSERSFPRWHPLAGEKGSPRLFIFGDRCPNLVEQLKDAPLEEFGKLHAGEAVHGEWESAHGHAHAALRYWALARPSPSKQPEPEIEDPRAALIARRIKRREQAPQETFIEL